MPDDLISPTDTRSIGQKYISWDNIERAARIAQERRRAAGEIMTYDMDGWVVREYPGQRIVRLARIGEYRSEDFPI